MNNTMFVIGVALAASFMVLVACGGGEGDPADAVEAAAEDLKKAGEDLAEAVEDVIDAAEDDAASALQRAIEEIKAAITEKEDELEAIKEKLASMSSGDLAGGDGNSLKEKSEALMDEIKACKQKLEAAING